MGIFLRTENCFEWCLQGWLQTTLKGPSVALFPNKKNQRKRMSRLERIQSFPMTTDVTRSGTREQISIKVAENSTGKLLNLMMGIRVTNGSAGTTWASR